MGVTVRQGINPPGLQVPGPAYSQVVVSGDLVYTSGQVGRDEHGVFVSDEVEAQTRKALENIRTALEAVGCSMDDVIKVSTFLGDNRYFRAYDAVYREFFSAPYPARTTVAVEFDDQTLLEIDVVARKPA
jgi:2-iminobutanoate/2-iminopropanoate deaminase